MVGLEVCEPQVELQSRQMGVETQGSLVMLDGKLVLPLAG